MKQLLAILLFGAALTMIWLFRLRQDGTPVDPIIYLYVGSVVDPEKPAPQVPAGFVTATGSLNVRTGPWLDFPKVGLLPEGTQVEKVGSDGPWVAVKLWVHGD